MVVRPALVESVPPAMVTVARLPLVAPNGEGRTGGHREDAAAVDVDGSDGGGGTGCDGNGSAGEVGVGLDVEGSVGAGVLADDETAGGSGGAIAEGKYAGACHADAVVGAAGGEGRVGAIEGGGSVAAECDVKVYVGGDFAPVVTES